MEWTGVERAERDLGLAALALQATTPFYDGVAYHAQQAAEKALKGILAAHGRALPKTHHLLALIDACQDPQPAVLRFTNAAASLTPYATEFRYPGGRLEPSPVEAEMAYQHAVDIINFVRDILLDTDQSG